MFLLFWSKFRTTPGEVLHGLDFNASVASGPEQRSVQQEEMTLHVQVFPFSPQQAINQLMALESKTCKKVFPGMLCGIVMESIRKNNQHAFSFLYRFLFAKKQLLPGNSYP